MALPQRPKYMLHPFPHRQVFEVRELAGVEERTAAGGALFVVDVGLVGHGELDEFDAATRAVDVAQITHRFALRRVTRIDAVFAATDVLEVIVFSQVEPDTFAETAAIDRKFLNGYGPHHAPTFRTVHVVPPAPRTPGPRSWVNGLRVRLYPTGLVPRVPRLHRRPIRAA